MTDFSKEFINMIPLSLPELKEYDFSVDHAPKRPSVLNKKQRKLVYG